MCIGRYFFGFRDPLRLIYCLLLKKKTTFKNVKKSNLFIIITTLINKYLV